MVLTNFFRTNSNKMVNWQNKASKQDACERFIKGNTNKTSIEKKLYFFVALFILNLKTGRVIVIVNILFYYPSIARTLASEGGETKSSEGRTLKFPSGCKRHYRPIPGNRRSRAAAARLSHR